MGHARGAVHVGCDGLQNRTEGLPRLRRATRHDGRAVQSALLATRDARADEVAALLSHLLLAADRVGEQGVSAVDDDVTLIHGLCQLINDRIRCRTGLNHDDGLARALQGGNEILDALRGDEVTLIAVLRNQGAGLFRAAVVHGDSIAVVCEVARQVGAHDSQAHNTNLSEFSLFSSLSHVHHPTSPQCSTLVWHEPR